MYNLVVLGELPHVIDDHRAAEIHSAPVTAGSLLGLGLVEPASGQHVQVELAEVDDRDDPLARVVGGHQPLRSVP